MEIAPAQRTPFKINKAVSTYDAVCMMMPCPQWSPMFFQISDESCQPFHWCGCSCLQPSSLLQSCTRMLGCLNSLVESLRSFAILFGCHGVAVV